MKISDLQGLLGKVQSIAGDVEVVLKAAETEVETVITDLGIHLDPSSGNAGGTLEVTHGTAAPADPAQTEQPAPTYAPPA